MGECVKWQRWPSTCWHSCFSWSSFCISIFIWAFYFIDTFLSPRPIYSPCVTEKLSQKIPNYSIRVFIPSPAGQVKCTSVSVAQVTKVFILASCQIFNSPEKHMDFMLHFLFLQSIYSYLLAVKNRKWGWYTKTWEFNVILFMGRDFSDVCFC